MTKDEIYKILNDLIDEMPKPEPGGLIKVSQKEEDIKRDIHNLLTYTISQNMFPKGITIDDITVTIKSIGSDQYEASIALTRHLSEEASITVEIAKE